MRKFAWICGACGLAFVIGSTSMVAAQVGVGTPDCHTQGVLYRMANHCPPEAIAAAAQHPPVEYRRLPARRHVTHWRRHRHIQKSSQAE